MSSLMYSKNNIPILLWGATGQAIVLKEIIEKKGYRLLCLFDRNKKIQSPFKGISVYHDRSKLFQFLNGFKELYFAVAIGGDGGAERIAIHNVLVEKGMKPATLIHPQSHVTSDAVLNEGSQILINATVCSRARIGRQAIINSSSSIDHECQIDDGVHIGPGSVLSGCVSVGSCTFIGSGSVVLPRITIGKHSIIGAGSVVTKNIPDGVVAFGNPCRVIRKNE